MTTLLSNWPFAIVPDATRAKKWAGRRETRLQLEALLSRWNRRATSEISVMWADFGQGKTHSLLHIASTANVAGTTTHYVQLPPLTTGSPFVALYRQVLRDFPLVELGRRVFERYHASPLDLPRAGTPATRGIIQLLWLVGTNAPGAETAARWLRGDRVSSSELAALSIGGRPVSVGSAPATAQDCQNILDALITMLVDFPVENSGRFVLLIDEFQRIGELTPRKRIEVCNALHLLFNRHPNGFRLVLAFAGGLPEIVPAVLTEDLMTRINARIDLPPLTLNDGKDYLVDLISTYEITEPFGGPYEELAVTRILQLVATDGELSPRRINIGFDLVTNAVLDERTRNSHDLQSRISRTDVDNVLPLVRDHLVQELGDD